MISQEQFEGVGVTDKRRTTPAPPTHQNLVQEDSRSRSFTFKSVVESAL